jgi:hypothetical protein
MIGLCLEAETTCGKCGKPLPMNALTENIVCTQCNHNNNFTIKEWKDLLADLFKEGPTYTENEGTPSTVFGPKTYKIIYGRQNPKFLDTKTYMNIEEAIKGAASGKVVNPETGFAYSIRPLPENFKEVCPNVTYLFCEDFTQLPLYSGPSEVLDRAPQGELIPFNCPDCGGALQITGSERKFKCKFCGIESFVPDETWQKMHPVKTKQRFYFLFDENSMVFEWDSDLWDMVADADGTLYLSVDPIFGSDDKLWVVALKPDLTVKWKRNNIKFQTTTCGGEAKLGLTVNGELMVWSGDRSTMVLLSAADGSEIKRIGKKYDGTEKQNNTLMDFTMCRYITADIDGNYAVWVDRDHKDSDSDSYCEFMMMDKDANLYKPWGMGDLQSKGFFGSLKNAFKNIGEAPYFDKIDDKVFRCRDFDIKISVGFDGSYYMVNFHHIAKYNRHGEQIYLNEITGGSIWDKIAGDKQGNAYYIFEPDGTDKYLVMQISADGSTENIFINNVLDGGGLCQERNLALSSNGTMYCAGYSGVIRTFSADGKLLYASSKSLEDEADEIKKKKDMED